MNNIRGFSYNVPTRDAAPTAEARNGVPELPEAGSGPNIFESVLTGVSQGNDREARQAPLSTPQQAGSQADSAAQKGVGSSGQKDVGSLEFRLGTFTGSLAGLAETQASSRVFPDFPETGGSLNRARDQKVSADGESPLAASIADAASMGVSAPDLPASKSAPAIKASQAAITAKDLPKIPNSASKSAPQTATNSVQNNPAFFSPKTRAIASFNPVSLSNGTQAMAQNATAAPRNGRGSQDSSVAPTSVTPSKRRATEASQPASASNTGPVVAVPILPNFALPVSAPLPVETPDGSSSAPAQRQINLQNRDGQASQLGGQGQSIEMKANVISAATHFAPVATLS
ncbi:MAG TPA: hypothetical protein VKV77_02700, partial [Methylovirgula sp.]|nr:hypothetical protein [Methylovirgula sp.]